MGLVLYKRTRQGNSDLTEVFYGVPFHVGQNSMFPRNSVSFSKAFPIMAQSIMAQPKTHVAADQLSLRVDYSSTSCLLP